MSAGCLDPGYLLGALIIMGIANAVIAKVVFLAVSSKVRREEHVDD